MMAMSDEHVSVTLEPTFTLVTLVSSSKSRKFGKVGLQIIYRFFLKIHSPKAHISETNNPITPVAKLSGKR